MAKGSGRAVSAAQIDKMIDSFVRYVRSLPSTEQHGTVHENLMRWKHSQGVWQTYWADMTTEQVNWFYSEAARRLGR